MSVIGVDQHGSRRPAGKGEQSRRSPERPALGRVCMDDVRPLTPENADQAHKRWDVAPTWVTAHPGHEHRPDPKLLCQIVHVSLVGLLAAPYQGRCVTELRE